MDPNLMKFLEEDEDETMHSGADVEAFTAELNRDIEGNGSTSQEQPSDSDTSALCQGSSRIHFLQQWQTSSHDGVANFQSGQDLMAMEEKEQHSSQVEMQKHGSDSQNRKEDDNSSDEPNPLLHNPSMDACPQPPDDRSNFPLSQLMVTQTSVEQQINMQGLDDEPKTEKEPQMDKVQNISHHPSTGMGLDDQQSSPMEFKDQHSLLTAQGNQQTNMGISSEQIMPPVNQHITGMTMCSQQAMTSGTSNQQSMTNSNQQVGTSSKLNKVPFAVLLPFIQPQLDKDRAMQLHTLYFKLKKNEISKDGFFRHMRSIVGDHMLKMAVYKLQTQAAGNPQTVTNQFQPQPQAPARPMQVSSNAQLPTDLSNSTNENTAAKSREVENQADTQGVQTSFPTYGNAGSSYSPFPATNTATSTSIRPLAGQKKPMETPRSSPPSSKKQKVSGAFLDQSIEHLNDVTAVSGVNLREEEEQLFSGPKEDRRIAEASRRVVQEEEDRLILHKIPLQKKVMEIMVKCGLKNMSNDVERYLSLCVEERMRGLISSIIRLSKQRVDIEKPRHKTITTSDVRQQIMTINRKAHGEWEKKQAETEKSKNLNDPESSNGVDGDKEKDESRSKSAKANKEEDDRMRTTAANVAVRAATGVSDMLSRWQLMAEKQKQGGSDNGSQTSKDVGRKQAATSTRNRRENQESEKRDSSAAFTHPASIRKVGRNQVVVPRVARSISVKDVIGVLEREPQMSKSMLLYRLY